MAKIARGGRVVETVKPGSEEERYFDVMNVEASAGGEGHRHILLREHPGKAAVLEKFLHGTQSRLGISQRLRDLNKVEAHVKDFMIRHRKMLGLGQEDVDVLKLLLERDLRAAARGG